MVKRLIKYKEIFCKVLIGNIYEDLEVKAVYKGSTYG